MGPRQQRERGVDLDGGGMREPLLASRNIPGDEYGRKVRGFLGVYGGLHMIKGNHAPYFTITTEVHQSGYPDREWGGGADHETILRYWPEKFADLVALHLSDIDGVPMHAVANGWYALAGALGGAGETYHRGNAESYGRMDTSPDGCLKAFAEHLRIPLAHAESIREEFKDRELVGADAKARLAEIVDTLRPQWKREADDCRARHHLAIFGDAWPA